MTLCKRVFLFTSPYTCAHCAQYSPLIPLWLASQVLHLLEERQNHSIVRFAYLCYMIAEKNVPMSFLYIKLFELGVEVAFNNQSAITHHKANLLKFPLRSSCSERSHFRAAALSAPMMLLCCPFAFASFTSSLSVDCVSSVTNLSLLFGFCVACRVFQPPDRQCSLLGPLVLRSDLPSHHHAHCILPILVRKVVVGVFPATAIPKRLLRFHRICLSLKYFPSINFPASCLSVKSAIHVP